MYLSKEGVESLEEKEDVNKTQRECFDSPLFFTPLFCCPFSPFTFAVVSLKAESSLLVFVC